MASVEKKGVLISGHPVEKVAPGRFKMSNKNLGNALAEHGATKEVRKIYEEAEEAVRKEAAKLACKETVENEDVHVAEVLLGSGNGQHKVKVRDKVVSRIPDPDNEGATKEIDSYGVLSYRKYVKYPSSEKKPGGTQHQIRQACAAKFGVEIADDAE